MLAMPRGHTRTVLVHTVYLSFLLTTTSCLEPCNPTPCDNTPRPSCFHTQGKGDVYCMDQDMTAYSQTYYKDYENRRIIEVMSDSAPGPALFVYRNFTTSKKFLMMRDGTCFILPMVDENTHCIPTEAEFRHSIQLEAGHKSGTFRRLEAWEFQSVGDFDGRVIDMTDGRRHPYVFRKRDNFVTYWFDNVKDGLDEDDFLFFDVDLSACVEVPTTA